MELCINGCGGIWESRELLEVLDSIMGVNNSRHDTNEPIEDTALLARIERMAKRKLTQKGKEYNAKGNH